MGMTLDELLQALASFDLDAAIAAKAVLDKKAKHAAQASVQGERAAWRDDVARRRAEEAARKAAWAPVAAANAAVHEAKLAFEAAQQARYNLPRNGWRGPNGESMAEVNFGEGNARENLRLAKKAASLALATYRGRDVGGEKGDATE